jgi:hypothetical protein
MTVRVTCHYAAIATLWLIGAAAAGAQTVPPTAKSPPATPTTKASSGAEPAPSPAPAPAGAPVETAAPATSTTTVAEPTLSTTETPLESTEFVDDLEHRTFNFFWEAANPVNGLVPDHYPGHSFASISAVGFALTAYPIGIERGWVTREAARDRVLATLRFFRDAPQGTAAQGMTGYKGFYYHFLDMQTGLRDSPRTELSLIDTALLIAGVLYCETYFDKATPEEAELREIADELYRRVDWAWASRDDGEIALGWSLEYGFHARSWRGYNEAMILYVLALGSPTHPIPDTAWQSYISTNQFHWEGPPDERYLGFPPLFGHQYSHVWIDFRDIRDAFIRDTGMDYFENSRRATWAQQRYAIANPMHWKAYGPLVWGISASDGPADMKLPYDGETRVFHSYAARGPGGAHTFDDGTISPSALAGSMPFAAEIVLPALEYLKSHYGKNLYSTYGFLDAFDPSFDYDVPLVSGRRIAGQGWFDTSYLGIDEGLTITMVENYRTGMIWRIMRQNPYLRRGLERAGFRGGWLEIHP